MGPIPLPTLTNLRLEGIAQITQFRFLLPVPVAKPAPVCKRVLLISTFEPIQQPPSVSQRSLQNRVGPATHVQLRMVCEPMFYPVLTAMRVLRDPVPPAATTIMLPVLWVLHSEPEVVLPNIATDLTLSGPRPPRLFEQGTLLMT